MEYIKNVLKLDVNHGGYELLEKNDNLYDVITSFFVIEHIKDFKKLLFLFYMHLKKNGVLALSTPNADGISIKFKFNNYIREHPDDHYAIFSPKTIKNILKGIGFGKIKIVITGIHAERFIKSEKLLKFMSIHKIYSFFAKLFQLGDTFEIYAQKL